MKRYLLTGLFSVVALALCAIVVSPKLRESVQSKFSQPGREILATAEGDLLNTGAQVRVIKYRGEEGLFVEVLKMESSGDSTLVDRILLPDKHDGLFNYQGHVTRLAIADVDGDGKVELLAPSFDNQLVPHLNVFRYNAELGRFEPFPAAAQ